MKTNKEILDGEVKGLAEDFDKGALIFSYNDVLEILDSKDKEGK